MRCNQCGTEFTGKFCPECGARVVTEGAAVSPPVQYAYQQPVQMAEKPAKKKKPFYLRIWFIILVVIVINIVVISVSNGCDSCAADDSEKIVWGDTAFSAKNAIKIEDIDWSVTESVMDAERFVSFNYTNNSKYTILDVEMKFVKKDDVTKEQLAVFDELKAEHEWTDEDVSDIYILGYNRKCAEPGETVSDSPCCINGTYTIVESIEQYEIMEPDMATIAFIGEDGKGYVVYYDFRTQTYGESSQGGQDIQQWSNSEISKLLPKAEAPAIKVSYDDEDYFSFRAYGVSMEMFEKYVEAVKNNGFSEVDFESSTSYCATNADGVEVYITYTAVEEVMMGSVEGSIEEEQEVIDSEEITDPEEVTDYDLDPDFKEAMDSYEEFIDEYVALLEKYYADPSDSSLLSDYAEYMTEYEEFVEDFEKWEDEDLNDAEVAYYIEVQNRVSKKLLEVGQ